MTEIDYETQAYVQTIQDLAQQLADEKLKSNTYLVALYQANEKIKELESEADDEEGDK